MPLLDRLPARDPARHVSILAHRIERAARGQRRTERTPPRGTIGIMRAQRGAGMVELFREPPEPRRQQRLQPLAQRRRQPCRHATGADRVVFHPGVPAAILDRARADAVREPWGGARTAHDGLTVELEMA